MKRIFTTYLSIRVRSGSYAKSVSTVSPFQTDPFYGTGRETLASGHVTDAARLNLSNVSDPLTTQGTVAPTSRMLGETPSSCAVKGVPVECAPLVEFITKREHGFSPEQMAHRRTGRNIRTGKLHLGVSLRRRNNGMVRIEADFWRLPCDLNARAIERFESRWRLLNEATPAKVQARMQRHFSRTALQFDTMAEQADDWQDLLATVLSEPSSYVGID